MQDEDATNLPRAEAFHELAEGLQSASAYVGAALRLSILSPSENASVIEMLKKATDALARSETAFHRARKLVLGMRGAGRASSETDGGADHVGKRD